MESSVLMILSGQFIGFLPNHYARDFERDGLIRAIDGERTKFYDDFSIAVPRKHPNAAATRFAEAIKANIT